VSGGKQTELQFRTAEKQTFPLGKTCEFTKGWVISYHDETELERTPVSF
jgi:hypothetical protein